MRSLEHAIAIFETNIKNYQASCKYNHLLSDTEAFFLNLIPFGKRYGGTTGYQRATNFLEAITTAINSRRITQTSELIDFAMNYKDKGTYLSLSIWKSIRESAGFTQEHVTFLSHLYSLHHMTPRDHWPDGQYSAETWIHTVLGGTYPQDLLICLDDYLGLQSRYQKDYGERLLNYLNNQLVLRQEANMVSHLRTKDVANVTSIFF